MVRYESRTLQKCIEGAARNRLRYKLSKESADKTLSFLFQDDFEGCAEIGLTGDDDFHFKVSPDGTSWLESIRIDRATGKVSFPSGGAREILAANRTYYVRTDGSDSNDGLSNTSGGAFLTIQKAIDVAAGLDSGGYRITVQIADGTYAGFVTLKNIVGFSAPGDLVIQGNNSTPANVVISNTSQVAFTADSLSSVWDVLDLKIISSGTSAHGIIATRGSKVRFGNLNFGTVAGDHLLSTDLAEITAIGNYTISGGANNHSRASGISAIRIQGKTVTLSGTPAFPSAFAASESIGLQFLNGNTYSGSATGSRYSASSGGVINTVGAGSTYLPGNASGTGTNSSVSPYGSYF